MDENDPDFLIAVCRRRPQAFAALVSRFQAPLYTFLAHLGGPEAAETAFFDTWREVFRRAGDYGGRGQAARWIFTIALAHARKAPRPALPSVGEDLAAGIEALPVDAREVYLLRECAGLKYAEIAETLQEPLESVLGRMNGALGALGPRLERLRG